MQKVWFKAKRYGWGWYPATWQGWLVLAVAIGAIVLNGVLMERMSQSTGETITGSGVFTFLVVILLTGVCYLKGEKPRWRWGGK